MFSADKQALQQSFGRPFWNKKESTADSQKVLLADAAKRHWGLCQGMQRVFGFKGSLSSVLKRSLIFAYIKPIVEKPIHRFYNGSANLNQ